MFEPGEVRRDRLAGVSAGLSVGARALLPLRLFLGGSFLYAGFDKLLDPRFFDPSSPASIQAQLLAFSRTSPLAPLVRVGQPYATPIGLLIAIAEIAVGLGALTGLAFRAAAWAGAGLSLLFFLTASWTTRPFYYGPDLPFLAGWVTLGLAGHGGLLVLRRLIVWADGLWPTRSSDRTVPRGRAAARGGLVRSSADDASAPLRDRRTVLQGGVLGLLALVAASFAIPFRSAGATLATDEGRGADASPGATAVASAAASPAVSPSASAGAVGSAGLTVAKVADLARTGSRAFTVPFTAPAPLPAGDPAVIVRLADGSYVAFDAVCTHAGCTVQWDSADRVLLCPCHGAAFDPANGAAVLQGPTDQPLASIPIVVDAASGTVSLRV